MDYFDKQDFKNKSHENCNQNMHESFPMSKNVFPDNWKVPQDGDFDFACVFEEEDQHGEVFFSSHHTQCVHHQYDLSLLMLILIAWPTLCLSALAIGSSAGS
uniref:Serine/threonine kinase 3 n=1 Tax=Rousettus aegyptiacus TaxID=9407 RepID=A0A7J8C4I9_ROUAE|nr:serine/threonine kinase 3 [Rousettus aegyptiacus]